MFNARVFFAASVMTLFLHPMSTVAADVSPPGGVADGVDLPNVTSTPCTGQPDGYEWTNKKSGRTFVCQNGVSVLKGLNPPKRPCVADVTPNGFSDEHCRGAVTNEDGKMGTGGKGNDKTGSGGDGKGGNGTGKGSGGGTGGGSGSGGGSAGSGSGSGNGGAGAGSGSGGSGSAGSGSGNGVQGSGAASPDKGSGGGSGSGSGATSGNDAGGSGGSGSGSGSGDSGTSNSEYLAAIREWGKKWAEFFKKLAQSEENIQQTLPKTLTYCLNNYGRNTIDAQKCSDDAIKSAEKSMKELEEIRQKSIERMAKEKAAIDAMKPSPVPAVPMPDAGGGVGGGVDSAGVGGGVEGAGAGVGGGAGNNSTNTTTITTTTTTSNNTTNNITHNTTTNNNTMIENKFEDKNDMEAFCKTHPQALSCITTKDAKFDDKNEDVKEEKPSKDFSKFKVTNYFSGGGACPADVSVNVGIFGSFALSYGWLCRLASIMRPLVIAFAWLSALFIIVKGSRSE